MIKDFIYTIIGVAFLSVVCEMILPQGRMKQYFKLVMGFIMLCVLLKPALNITDYPEVDFSFDNTITEAELQAESRAYILRIHEENIRKKVMEVCGDDTKVFIELFSDGNIKSVTLRGNVSEEKIEYLRNELGCENITLKNGDVDEEGF